MTTTSSATGVPEVISVGAVETARRLRARELSSRELITALLDRIDEVNPQVNALRVVHADQALRAADAADRRAWSTASARGATDQTSVRGGSLPPRRGDGAAGERTRRPDQPAVCFGGHDDWRAAYHADTEHLWARDRVVTTYRRIDTA